ncbi:MAG: hypothetical protein ACP5XB_20355 [Isosphaeraceae bacterium]
MAHRTEGVKARVEQASEWFTKSKEPARARRQKSDLMVQGLEQCVGSIGLLKCSG